MYKFTVRFLVALSTFVIGIAITSFVGAYLNRQTIPLVTQTPARLYPAPEVKSKVDAEWQKIVRDKFTFDLPSDMQPVYGYKEPSGDRSYSNGHGLQIIYWYSGSSCIYPIYPSKPPINEELIEVDGIKAKFGVDSFEGSDIHVPYVCFSQVGNSKSKLSIMAYSHGQEGVELAKQIFRSVRFRR